MNIQTIELGNKHSFQVVFFKNDPYTVVKENSMNCKQKQGNIADFSKDEWKLACCGYGTE